MYVNSVGGLTYNLYQTVHIIFKGKNSKKVLKCLNDVQHWSFKLEYDL